MILHYNIRAADILGSPFNNEEAIPRFLLAFAVVIFNRTEKGVDICPTAQRRDVATGRNDEIWVVGAASRHYTLGFGVNRFRGPYTEFLCGAYIAHYGYIRRYMPNHLNYINGIAEVISHTSGGQDSVDHPDRVISAIVINHGEFLALYRFNNLLHIGRGKFLYPSACPRARTGL